MNFSKMTRRRFLSMSGSSLAAATIGSELSSFTSMAGSLGVKNPSVQAAGNLFPPPAPCA